MNLRIILLLSLATIAAGCSTFQPEPVSRRERTTGIVHQQTRLYEALVMPYEPPVRRCLHANPDGDWVVLDLCTRLLYLWDAQDAEPLG